MSRATLIIRRRQELPEGLIEVVVWAVPSPVPPSQHGLKYRLVYVVAGDRVVGYDNERGKGDHKHIRGVEYSYDFTDLAALLDDFEADVVAIRGEPI
jgi:hypothetical protein